MPIETTVIGSYPLDPPLDSFASAVASVSRGEGYFDPFLHPLELSVKEQILAGIDIVSDGQTRADMVSIFASRLRGIRKFDNVYSVIGDIGWPGPITIPDQKMVKKLFPKVKLKGIITGPFTMAKSVRDCYYSDMEELTMEFARALNREATALDGIVDVIDVDEPFLSVEFPQYANKAVKTVLDGVTTSTCLHVCGDVEPVFEHIVGMPVDILSHEFRANPNLIDTFNNATFSQKICLGSVRTDSEIVESVEEIECHINRAINLLDDRIIHASPDCGLRRLPRKIAFKKLANLSEAARRVNEEN